MENKKKDPLEVLDPKHKDKETIDKPEKRKRRVLALLVTIVLALLIVLVIIF